MLAPPKNDIQDEIAFLIKKWFLYTKTQGGEHS